jgi:hypothetical protein
MRLMFQRGVLTLTRPVTQWQQVCMVEMRLPIHFQERSATRVVGATETDHAPVAHVDVHGFSAGRTGRPLWDSQAIRSLEAELSTADLAEVSLLAGRRLSVAVDGVSLATRAEDSVDQFAFRLSGPVRWWPHCRYRLVPPDADVCLGCRLHTAFDVLKCEGVVLSYC